MCRGYTLLEVVVVLVMTSLLLASIGPLLIGWRDGLAVRRASWELVAFYQTARYAAITRSTRVRIDVAPDSLRAVFEGAREVVLMARAGPARLGVTFSASRNVIRISPNGIGWGAANTTMVLQRGAVTDSLTTSRLGRLRRL